jgi:5-methylcytosine-specific restriction endonuclease McrA
MTERRRFCPRGHDTFEVGRDSSYRCLVCKRESAVASAARRNAEAAAAATEQRKRERVEADRRREREGERAYQRAIKAGGRVAAEAKWSRAFNETLDATGGRYELCQWEDEIDDEYTHTCFNRSTDLYCSKHNRQLEREIERKRKAKERESEHAAPEWTTPSASRARRRPARYSTSNWATYKAKHPARVAFYASSTWRSMRDRQLRDHPDCVVCGKKASHADHVLAIANGGTPDGPLQSMCRRCHLQKTVRDSHQAAKRAAASRGRRQP